MTPEKNLILAILRQAIRDYIRLDPDSDTVSAEYHIDEGSDFQTAEDFLYNNEAISCGDLRLMFRDVCMILGIDEIKLKNRIAKSAIEY